MSFRSVRDAIGAVILSQVSVVKSVQGHYGAFDLDFIEAEARKVKRGDVPAVFLVFTGISGERRVSGMHESLVEWAAFVVTRDAKDTTDVKRGDTAAGIAGSLVHLIKREDWQGTAQDCGENVRVTNLNSVTLVDHQFQAFLVTWNQWFSDRDIETDDADAQVLSDYLVQHTTFVMHDEDPPEGTPVHQQQFNVRGDPPPEDP